MFCDLVYVVSVEYKKFWEWLGSGVFDKGEYKCFVVDGCEVWINVFYNLVMNSVGKLYKVIKFVIDIIVLCIEGVEVYSKMVVLDKVQVVIEFDFDGYVLYVNSNFLVIVGYLLEEIQGWYYCMFCDEVFVVSLVYVDFWIRLCSGQFDLGCYCCIGKGGCMIWL